ncbi:hypothetical protein ACIPSE_29315 [Streptomyces sp. NPDC090106]|uniref:hypothetical protein n=1 Tax=Streptomyces sp. NPDC090106 TaxID=3365946 RepID=UPI003814CB75
MAWTFGGGTIAPGATQEWWFAWGGNGDVGPQLIQAQPLNPNGLLFTTQIGEVRDGNNNLSYRATVRNAGPLTVNFNWRGGGSV